MCSRTPFAAHPALWAVGSLTALLTAFYMSRLTGLAFFRYRPVVEGTPIDAETDMPGAHHAEGWYLTSE